ncbi:hypothetical protein [Streptomyces sp. RPT161]|uniref:hypothetical protein n=1 Tax=Streptomyces sp. RPT161 TaxID=3015993 RepID=UPI0022B930B2|nr:hypothetical protein [Streptomyces sp. RPT161]
MLGSTTSRAAAAAAVLASCALLLAGCSNSSGTSNAQAGASPSASASAGPQQMAAYRQCLSQHGVTVPARPSGRPSGRPGGGFGGGASADPARQRAMQACASLRPRFGGRGGMGGSAMQAFTSCMKDHGVSVGGHGPGALNTADPKTAKAYQTCRPLLPQHGNPSATAGPSA